MPSDWFFEVQAPSQFWKDGRGNHLRSVMCQAPRCFHMIRCGILPKDKGVEDKPGCSRHVCATMCSWECGLHN